MIEATKPKAQRKAEGSSTGFWERRRHIKEAKSMLRVGAQVENLHEALLVYKVGNSALINSELFEKYLERFREPARELPKHTWNKLKEMTNTPKTGENS